MNTHQKGSVPILIAITLLVLAGIGGASYYLLNKQSSKQTACTMEAKVCPDGSSVNRTGSNCEFTACPEIKANETTNWKTYTNTKYNYQISYPENVYTIENITFDPEKGMTDDNVTLYDIASVQKTKECECGEYTAIYINAYSNPQGLSLQNYIKENVRNWTSDYSNLFINEKISLNGIPEIEINTGREQYYILEKNNVIFSIGGYFDMNIINTFKFIDNQKETIKLDRNDLLQKMFSTLTFKNGIARTEENYDIQYENSYEDFFVNKNEKSLLLSSRGEEFELYLGLFDKDGRLLTKQYDFNSKNIRTISIWPNGSGSIYLYNCKGLKHILYVSTGCSTGGCCSDYAELFKISNGNFEKTQIINHDIKSLSGKTVIMHPTENKIVIKTVPDTSINGNCPESDYKELKWNDESCKFE